MSTILVVDDEYLIANILGWALEDEGFDVELAGNGQKALDLLKGKRVELVITDYMMPVMDGEALAVSIRAEPLLQALPIILMSGAQAHKGRDNPRLFAAVFDKPFDIDQLIAKVKELVGAPEAP
ncbi:response regulator [Pseudomonas wadenswilerensis]|jgi:CheY-like chemotaxis protein|uniref:Putative transcriptional regulatory protein n=1 Tax=Pseudomonas wadenswilerensis TaxID=1785161 RepID=A0A380T1L7_9PSED|nr:MULTISPECIES: response regulator [Pseudomonas]MCE5984468.1 response regulator [Pseudomonas sp. LF19]UVM19843.1 response regulator [Pseudomonas wadenswilerensis]SPO66936.1 putative response regulator [Pseudomonas sp. JV241A]SUQ63470.1 putative transcriptional regulatory protein [Pseudomonas wadenswilerensis]